MIKIPIHSTVDIITNSSSEIFILANQDTVNGIKNLVNNILRAAESSKTVDDLFEIKLIKSDFERGYVIVSSKNASSPYSELASRTLSSLESLFNISASYEG